MILFKARFPTTSFSPEANIYLFFIIPESWYTLERLCDGFQHFNVETFPHQFENSACLNFSSRWSTFTTLAFQARALVHSHLSLLQQMKHLCLAEKGGPGSCSGELVVPILIGHLCPDLHPLSFTYTQLKFVCHFC